MGPELILAIETCTIESASILISIGKKIKEIVVFKNKCLKLKEEAEILRNLLDKRSSALQTIEAVQNFQACLQHIDQFMDMCMSYSVLQTGLEVVVRKRYPSLKKEIAGIKELFILESVLAEILFRQELPKLTPSVDAIRNQIIVAKDQIVWDDSEQQSGRFESSSSKHFLVRKVHAILSTKRNLELYREIQHGAFVQQFFGLADIAGQSYAVLEDFTSEPTLASSCVDQCLPEQQEVRVLIAYNIAKSLAWYHKADLILKSLSDHSIVLQRSSDDQYLPYLTNIESLRHVLEKTTTNTNDVRYEAPEYALQKVHTRQTDIWSLGIVIWQCLTSLAPWDIRDVVLKDHKDVTAIRRCLTAGRLPINLQEFEIPTEVRDIILSCLNRNPMLRPTAAMIADRLLSCTVKLELATNLSEVDVTLNSSATSMQDEVITRNENAISCIKKARLLNEKSPIFKQADQLIPATDLHDMIEADKSFDPVESFIIGATVFWNLADGQLRIDEHIIETGLVADPEENRVIRAIEYLHNASQSGYLDASHELYKAHALLSRKYHARMSKP